MTNSKLCVLACCVGVSWATYVSAQNAVVATEDQQKELEALRQAEAGSTTEQILADHEAKKEAAKHKKEKVEQPAPVPAGISDDQLKALEALRQAEQSAAVPEQPAASAPEVTSPVVAAPESPSAQEKEAEVVAAERQRKEDALRIKEAKEAKKAAKLQAEKAAKEARIAKAKADKLAAEQAAANARAAQAPAVQPAPAPISSTAYTNALSKEQRLADLLRRYQADEITPYEYHMERAKIVSEP